MRDRETKRPIDRICEKYGDLLFDLCLSILWSQTEAEIAVRAIFRGIKAEHLGYQEYERAALIRVAWGVLKTHAKRTFKPLSSSERVMLDSQKDVKLRLKQLDSFLHRLPLEDQFVILLHDKYGLSYKEISAALGFPVDTLSLKRSQALKQLESKVYGLL